MSSPNAVDIYYSASVTFVTMEIYIHIYVYIYTYICIYTLTLIDA